MTFVVLGGALAQWPVGKWSDTQDRRRVLIVVTLAASVTGVLLFALTGGPAVLKLLLGLAFGASALPVYWVSVAHANDHAAAGESVEVSSNLLLIFATSAIAGPVFGSLFSAWLGTGGLFLFTALVHLAIAGLVYLRMQARGPVPQEEKDAFAPVPAKSSVQVFELDPRSVPSNNESEETTANGRRLLLSPDKPNSPDAEGGKSDGSS
jgi:MFS family permease